MRPEGSGVIRKKEGPCEHKKAMIAAWQDPGAGSLQETAIPPDGKRNPGHPGSRALPPSGAQNQCWKKLLRGIFLNLNDA